MDDLLTLDEIEARCQGEWVLIGDLERDPRDQLKGGRVLAHSQHRHDVYAVAQQLPKPLDIAVFCFRQQQPGEEYVL